MSRVEEARALIAAASKIAVLTGAGISTDSGIPDFRGPQGLWTSDPDAERRAHLRYYRSDPELRRGAWARWLANADRHLEPNSGHLALVELERSGRLLRLVTQNVDGLHHAAGNRPDLIVEVHGNLRETRCLDCHDRRPAPETLARVRDGDPDPRCLECGGMLKSATISFGQSLDPESLEAAEAAAMACDLLLAVGSTLSVYPVNGMVPLAARRDAAVVIVNGGPTDFDSLADVIVNESISTVLPVLVGGN